MSKFDGYSDAHSESQRRARRAAARLVLAVLAPRSWSLRRRTARARRPRSATGRTRRSRHPRRAAAPVSTPSFTANLRGNFVTASNTLLTCPDNPSAQRQRARAQTRAAGRRAVHGPQQQRPEHAVRQRRPGRAFQLQHRDADHARRRARGARLPVLGCRPRPRRRQPQRRRRRRPRRRDPRRSRHARIDAGHQHAVDDREAAGRLAPVRDRRRHRPRP